MKDESKKCYGCNNLERYYTKGIKQYNQTECGWCCKKRAIVNVHDGCEAFEQRRRKRREEKMIKHCLNDLLTEISEIRKIMEETEREREEM